MYQSIHVNQNGAALLCCEGVIDSENDKTYPLDLERKPVREEAVALKTFFQRNNFVYVDGIVDPCREYRSVPKVYSPHAVFMSLLLIYLS